MGLKCSLLGHDYGDVEVERTREEQGNEVVETVREVQRCERCGTESVVSENTEVRTVVDAAAVGLDADEEEAADGEREDEREPNLVSAVSRVDDSEGAGDGFDDVTPGDAAAHPRVDEAESEDGDFEPATDAAEDDAIILDDEAESEDESARNPGQWPSADDTRQAERDALAGASEAESDGGDADAAASETSASAGSWPDHDGADEGFAAEPGGSTADAEVGPGQPAAADSRESTGESTSEEGFDAEFIDASGDSAGDVGGGAGLTCPECGFDAESSPSLRAGDICPECHRGYLSDAGSE